MPFPAKLSGDRILAEALRLLEREGTAGLSLRSLAAELGVAPNALYRYFPDRSALLAALADVGAEQLQATLEKPTQSRGKGERSPGEAVRAMALAYLRFAREHPHLYDAMLLPGCMAEETAVAHLALWEYVVGQVARLTGPADAPRAAVALWSLLHGTAALERAGVFGAHKPSDSYVYGLNLWIKAAESTPHSPRPARAKKQKLR